MKKLTRHEMKNVMGGDVKETGCKVVCCLVEGHCNVSTSAYYAPSCAEGELFCTNGAGIVLGCSCFQGPALP